MNSAYNLLPTYIPSEVCDKIYLFVGIQTPSCIAFLPYNEDVHADDWFTEGVDTVWSLRSRLKVPYALRLRPCGTWRNEIDLDVIVAYHHAMIAHLSNCTCHTPMMRSNILMHIEYVNTTYSCDNTRITKYRSNPL
jgi:hypothetical protein